MNPLPFSPPVFEIMRTYTWLVYRDRHALNPLELGKGIQVSLITILNSEVKFSLHYAINSANSMSPNTCETVEDVSSRVF